MRLSRLGLVLVLLGSKNALAQLPVAPAAEPAPADAAHLEPSDEPPPAVVVPPPEQPPPPEATPAPSVAPPPVTPPAVGPPEPPPAAEPAPAVAPAAAPSSAPWPRAHSPLTLEGRLGFLLRPDSSAGFDHESNAGAELGLSLYLDLKREFAAGLEIERASLGRGTAITGLDSVSIDYTVSSAMLGVRAYPMRGELFDVFVGLQVGVGVQGVSATGTANNGGVLPASAYSCGASDVPALQLGGGIGARLMLTPRWGVTARVNGTGRRLTSDVVEDCAQGIGTATTLSAGLGLGYDFDLDP